MTTGARIVGLRETVRALERYGVSTQDLKRAFGRISSNVTRSASSRVPRKSDRLGNTIRPSRTKNKAVVRAGGLGGVRHAGPIHYGWPAHGIEAQPFLASAANDATDESVRLMEQELQDLARRYNIK